MTVFERAIWPQTMVGNRNQLCRPIKSDILKKLSVPQQVDVNYQPFGDGHTAEKIVKYIEKYFEEKIL